MSSVTYFGDGAANQGQVYESFNMAELWKLPVIYVIENNRYAMGTSITRSSARSEPVAARPIVQHSRRAGRRHGRARGEGRRRQRRRNGAATARARIILEMLTYRYRGHSMSDPAKYRTREEVEKCAATTIRSTWRAHRILEKKFANEDELKKIDGEVRDLINEAAEFATHDPEPDVSELYTNVYR